MHLSPTRVANGPRQHFMIRLFPWWRASLARVWRPVTRGRAFFGCAGRCAIGSILSRHSPLTCAVVTASTSPYWSNGRSPWDMIHSSILLSHLSRPRLYTLRPLFLSPLLRLRGRFAHPLGAQRWRRALNVTIRALCFWPRLDRVEWARKRKKKDNEDLFCTGEWDLFWVVQATLTPYSRGHWGRGRIRPPRLS